MWSTCHVDTLDSAEAVLARQCCCPIVPLCSSFASITNSLTILFSRSNRYLVYLPLMFVLSFTFDNRGLDDEKMKSVEDVEDFEDELANLKTLPLPLSNETIEQITMTAMLATKKYKAIVQSMETFIDQSEPKFKLPGLHIIDAIVRKSMATFGDDKDVFAGPFSQILTRIVRHALGNMSRSRSHSPERRVLTDKQVQLGHPPAKPGHLTISSVTLWVGDLPPEVSATESHEIFSRHGRISQLYLIKASRCAYIGMEQRAGAVNAYFALNKSQQLFGSRIKFFWAPGHRMRAYDFKQYWCKKSGCSYIPYRLLTENINLEMMAGGGQIDEDTIPEWFKGSLKSVEVELEDH